MTRSDWARAKSTWPPPDAAAVLARGEQRPCHELDGFLALGDGDIGVGSLGDLADAHEDRRLRVEGHGGRA